MPLTGRVNALPNFERDAGTSSMWIETGRHKPELDPASKLKKWDFGQPGYSEPNPY